MISTSVTEEGFDISDCNLVISFDEVDSLKNFIQMKGKSQFYKLKEEQDKKIQNLLLWFQMIKII